MDMYISSGVLFYLYESTMISMAAAESPKNNNLLNSVSMIECSDLDTYTAKQCLQSHINQYAVKIIYISIDIAVPWIYMSALVL